MLSDTRPTLLERIREARDPLAWEDFFERYWPTIFGFARRRGCSEHTAEEIVQDVMLKVFRQRDVFHYDRGRGRFRDWLGAVVRNQVAELRRSPAQRIRPVGGESAAVDEADVSDAQTPDELWQQTFENSLLLVMLDVVRRESNPRDYLAFELYSLRDLKASEVAKITGLSRNVVYKAHRKVLARLQQLAGSYVEDGSLPLRVKEALKLQPAAGHAATRDPQRRRDHAFRAKGEQRMMEPTADYSLPDDFGVRSVPSVPSVPDLQLLRVIGQGGFGQVWLARNRTTGHLRGQGDSVARHVGVGSGGREITSITRLEANLRQQHPNLLAIHHVGRTDRFLFYVMDPADDLSGKPAAEAEVDQYRPASLQSRLLDGPLPADECRRYARQLLSGLASLHEAGMVHRDVKPANCLLVGGELKLADFGLVAAAGPQVSRVGTEKYMPPDGRMDIRADVYAAGLVIYEMLSGMPPERFPQLGELAELAAVPDEFCRLVRLVLKACQPARDQRSAHAQAMLAELDGDLGDLTVVTRSRRKMLWWAFAAMLLVTAGLTYGLWPKPRVHVNFTTYPFEAEIYLDETRQVDEQGVPYRTPCTLENLPARPHRVTFRLAGRKPLEAGTIDFGTVRQITARWDGN